MAQLYTIGHSTRSLEELIAMLSAHGVKLLADVRTVPRSRRHPQFNRESLPEDLSRAGIEYVHMPALGGLRKPRADSPNGGWRNDSFRGYADYMQTEEFWDAVRDLVARAEERPTAIMCAEAVPWRCHRSLVADALTTLGHAALHIMTENRADPHRVTSFAVVRDRRLTYPAEGQATLFA